MGDSNAWWTDRSVPQKVLIVIGFALLGAGMLFLFGWVVMLLWNWLMPEIFGLKRITYWQGWGLLALCTILFKGMGSSNPGSSGKNDKRRKAELRRHMREGQSADEAAPASIGTETAIERSPSDS
jgi:hypothetical protein